MTKKKPDKKTIIILSTGSKDAPDEPCCWLTLLRIK